MSNVTEQEMGTLLSIISRADSNQLTRCAQAVQNRRQSINSQMIRQVRVGAKVKWNGKEGAKSGVVQKIKQKYVEVKDDASPLIWNVPAGMLTVVP